MNDSLQSSWNNLQISNDFLFGKIMRDPDVCKKLIEIILDIQIKRIEYPETQKTIDLTQHSRGIRLDVYVNDGDTVYNIEMQTSDTKELPKRSRYYQDLIDLQLIEKGETYNHLKKSYIIFICPFDLFNLGRHKYTFTYQCLEQPGLELGDETTKIFLNASSVMNDVGTELKSFLDYVAGKDTPDTTTAFVQKLKDLVKSAKNNQDWRVEYMTLEMRDRINIEKGREEGRKEALRELIINCQTKGFSVEEISSITQCDTETIISIINSNK